MKNINTINKIVQLLKEIKCKLEEQF